MKNLKKNYTNYIIIFFILLVFAVGSIIARYVELKNKSLLYSANSFYFESDILSDSTIVKSYVYKRGINEIEIDLKNYVDGLRNSEVDVKYSVAITDELGKSITDINGKKVENVTGVLKKNNQSSEIIKFSNLNSGNYIITATSTEPYLKILTATFKLSLEDYEIIYNVSDAIGSPIVQLTIETNDYEGTLVVSWPKGVSPDSTNEYFSLVNSGFNAGSNEIAFKANSEYVFEFFKENPNQLFNDDNFNVDRK